MRSGLGSNQILRAAGIFTAVFLRSNGSLPKFPLSGMGRQRNKVSLNGDWLMRYKTRSSSYLVRRRLKFFFGPRSIEKALLRGCDGVGRNSFAYHPGLSKLGL
jgi:hypothetical protein